MKKTLLVLALIACATFAFADGAVTATVGGSATATFGYDIGNGSSGFTNATSASLSFDIIPDSTVDNASDSYPYGYISLADFGFSFNSGNDPMWLGGTAAAVGTLSDGTNSTVDATLLASPKLPAVTAKLFLSPALYVLISSAPTFSYTYATGITYVTDDAAATDVVSATITNVPTGGLTVNYSLGDMGNVSVLFGSVGDWTTASNNRYTAGLAATITPASLLTVNLAAGYGDFATGDLFFTGKLTLTPADMISLWAAFDGKLPSGGSLTFDAEVATTITLTDIATVTLTDYIYPDTATDMDAQAVVSLSAVTDLTLSGTVDLFTLLSSPAFGFQVAASYNINGIVPGATFTLYKSGAMGIDAYVTLGGIVANTSFKLDWATTDLQNDLGAITAAATITY
jgi:hypothetical protein